MSCAYIDWADRHRQKEEDGGICSQVSCAGGREGNGDLAVDESREKKKKLNWTGASGSKTVETVCSGPSVLPNWAARPEKIEFKLGQDDRELDSRREALLMEQVGWPGWYEVAQVTDAHRHLYSTALIVCNWCDFERHALLFRKTRTSTTVANAYIVKQGRRWCEVVE